MGYIFSKEKYLKDMQGVKDEEGNDVITKYTSTWIERCNNKKCYFEKEFLMCEGFFIDEDWCIKE